MFVLFAVGLIEFGFQLIFPHFLVIGDRFPNVILPIRNMLMEESREGCNRAFRIGVGKCNNLKTHNSPRPNLNFSWEGDIYISLSISVEARAPSLGESGEKCV